MSQEGAQNGGSSKGRPRKDDIPPDSFGGQLTKGLDNKKIKPENLAEMLGVKRPSVVRWQRNKAFPTPENVKEINRILGTNLTRPPRTHSSKGKSKKASTNGAKSFPLRLVRVTPDRQDNLLEQKHAPLIGTIAAGRPIEEITQSEFRELPIPRRWLQSGFEVYALKVEGNSMKEDGILNGDIVFIRNNKTPNNGRVVVAHVRGGATLKRWFVSRNKVILRPANQDMTQREISRREVTLGRNEIECFGEMIGLLREV